MKRMVLLAAVLMAAASVNAGTIKVKEVVKGGDYGMFVPTEIQDGTLKYLYQDGYVAGDPMANAKGAPEASAIDSGYSMVPGPEYGHYGIALIRFDLASILPAYVTDSTFVTNAELTLYQGGPTGGEEMALYRVTTPWADEATTSAVAPSGSSDWAAGPVDGFGSGDYTTANAVTFTLQNNHFLPDNGQAGYTLDVTQLIKDMLDNGNNGFALVMTNATWPHNDAPYFRESEIDTTWNLKANGGERSPELSITVPEPASMSLLALGSLLVIRRKRA
jgi:hypothetical protein